MLADHEQTLATPNPKLRVARAQPSENRLLIDEVLAVGDEAFRAQCRRRIEELRNGGSTVVLVTHDLDMAARHGVAVERLKRFVAGADVFSKQSDGSTVAAQ